MFKKVIFALAFLLLLLPILGSVQAKETIVEQSFRIEPGVYKSWEFESEGSLEVLIACSSERFTFSLYLLDEDEFYNFKTDKDFEFVHQASTIFDADLVWEVPEGIHYVVAVNDFDDVAVHLEIEIETDDEIEDGCCQGAMIGTAGIAAVLGAIIMVVRRKRR
jgi:hypothetical protein